MSFLSNLLHPWRYFSRLAEADRAWLEEKRENAERNAKILGYGTVLYIYFACDNRDIPVIVDAFLSAALNPHHEGDFAGHNAYLEGAYAGILLIESVENSIEASKPKRWWCTVHKREATHVTRCGCHCCDPGLEGVAVPCIVEEYHENA